MKEEKLIPHLFRSEFSKMVAVLSRTFGLSNIQLAEDIVSETFLIATETWGLKGIPNKPVAWLYKVAENKTKDHFSRTKIFNDKITPELKNKTLNSEFEINHSDKNISDSQLQMLFAVCNPIISAESQITLALRVLCGFGINEISQAFLSNNETINKRLHRAKEKFRKHKINLSFPSINELEHRLENVLSIIYLLFNEGYYSISSEQILKKELCIEAMRLTYMLLENDSTNLPQTNALMALLCFHSSRFNARTNNKGELILYANQNKNDWDYKLINKGEYYLNKSAKGNITKYHLEAGISFWHTKEENNKNKWDNILQLYNQLLQIEYSPIAVLNRTYALSKAKDKKTAILEALKIDLKDNHFYHSLMAELYSEINSEKVIEHLNCALKIVKNENEKIILLEKLNALDK
jgi:RNA polymerase sigma-70 factor (ECF subfamily)